MATEIPEIMVDENGKPVPPKPTFENDTHKVQFDLDGFGPYRWGAFERLGPGHPWKCIAEAETEEQARQLIGLTPSSIMKTSVERDEAGHEPKEQLEP